MQCLNEEGLEIAKAASKAIRFGLDDHNPHTDVLNIQKIRNEVNDLMAVLDLLFLVTERPQFNPSISQGDVQHLVNKKEQILDYFNKYHGTKA